MMENPKYVRKIPITRTSRIEQEARSLMDSNYHGNYDWINKEIEKHYTKIKIKINIRSLILLRHDLTGNYKIDQEESEIILKGIEMY